MNFTPNQAGALRVPQQQQQQVHQAPVTSNVGPTQGGNMQKNSSMPNLSFPVNPQAANLPQKMNDDHNNKNQMPPTSVHHPVQQAGQNNNNHGMNAISQHIIAQHHPNINRNLNSAQPQPMMMANISQAGPQKSNVGIFQQISQMQQLYQSASIAQSQQAPLHHAGMPSQQNILHKLQAVIPPPIQMKPAAVQPQLQVKTVPQPTVSQQSMQCSPPKPVHPQMKTTAKLASPGSQLQSLQKSPTAPYPPYPMGQQAALQKQNVPSTPPTSSPTSSVALPAVSTNAVNVSPPKTQALPATPLKQLPVVVSLPSTTSVVPSQSVTTSSQLPAKQTPSSIGVEQASTKAVEQLKEAPPVVVAQNKLVPKPSVEDKKVAAETNNKAEKAPAVGTLVTPSKPVATAATPSKNTMRLATVTPARQKKPPPTKPPTAPTIPSVQKSPEKVAQAPAKPVEAAKTPTSVKKAPVVKASPAPATSGQSNASSTTGGSGSVTTPKTKRSRVKVQPYQSPTPELALVTKLSTQIANSSNKNGNDDNKLTIFYKNEFLALRNDEGTFFLCQTMHNVYKSSSKIRIRWLNEKNEGQVNESGARSYTLDFYDMTDFECVLTTVDLEKAEGKVYELPQEEQARIESILKKAIDVQKGIVPRPTVTEENPDGLDLSLYKDEAQLDKSSPRKRRRGVKSEEEEESDEDEDYEEHPKKKKIVKRPAAIKSPKMSMGKKISTVNDESTESDEENLMEIKKKAVKKQATTPVTPKLEKAPEPTPSTSKALLNTPVSARGRKRVSKSADVVEVPDKNLKVEPVKESAPLKTTTPSPKAKVVAKAKSQKKSVHEKASPVAMSPVEKKPALEKKLVPVKKAQPAEEKALVTKSPVVVKTSPAVKASSAKKAPVKATKASPAAASTPEQQPATPSTSRSRNTRSKK